MNWVGLTLNPTSRPAPTPNSLSFQGSPEPGVTKEKMRTADQEGTPWKAKKQKTKKVLEERKKHTKHFEENNLKINELSRKKGITRGSIRRFFSEPLSVDQETFIACPLLELLKWTQ